MAGESRVFEFEATAPKDAAGFRLVFNPTRSKIGLPKLTLAQGQKRQGMLPPIIYPPDLRFLVALIGQFQSPVPLKTLVRFQVPYTGERLQEPRIKWVFSLKDADPPDEEFKIIYRTRLSLAAMNRGWGDGRQAFFFDLDRFTHPVFIQFVRELSPDERQKRIRLVTDVMSALMERLELRRRRPTVAPARFSHDKLTTLTKVFSSAAFHLHSSNPSWTMGEALLQFAEGTLGWDVFRLYGAPYRLSNPDSEAIFLFAEFGIAAHGVLPSFWRLPLLLDLVKMQRYFLGRFNDDRYPFGDYGCPYQPLDPFIKLAIDLEYAAHGAVLNSIHDVERLIHENVNRTDPPRVK